MFGFIKKAFKGVGKVFKKVGKGIMKGFKAIGKFANKMGIFGQIGMMLLTGGIANAAFGALSTMGQGFMQGLSQSNNIIAKMAYSTLTGVKTVVAAPLKIGSSVFKNVTKGAFQALKDVGSHISNKMLGTTFNTTSTEGLWNSLGEVGSKYGGNIAKDTSAALGDAGNFLKDAVGKGPVKSDFRTFTPVGAENPVTKNLAYNTKATQQFEASKNVFIEDLKYKQAMSGQANMGNKPSFIETQNKITDFGTPEPVDSLLTKAKTGAIEGFKDTVSIKGMASPVASSLLSASTTPDSVPDTSLQIQPSRNIFGMNLQKSAATPTQFFNGFINNPEETFTTPDFKPFNFNQWASTNSPAYV